MIIQTTIFDFISTKLKVLELFGGIGACTAALKRLGIDFEVVDYVEIDKYAVASYNAINDTNFKPQDITKWDKNIEVDLIMHGSPCQDFSLAGKGMGGDKGSGTRSSLMYETLRIVEKLKPKYVIWENVKNLLSKKHRHNFDAYLETMEQLGYNNYYQVLNAKDYGIPQNRERVFTISIRKDINKLFTFPPKQELKLRLKDMLEDKVDDKYYLSEDKIKKILHWKSYQKPFERIQGKNSIVSTLTGRGAGLEHSGMIIISENIEETIDLQNKTICLNSKVGRNGIEGLQPSCQNRIYDSDFISPSITTSFMPSFLIKNATKQGYLEAHDGDGCYISNIDKKRGTVQKEMIPTLKTSLDVGVVTSGVVSNQIIMKEPLEREGWYRNAKEVLNVNSISKTILAQSNNLVTKIKELVTLRIRKLTPKECWRLMGFNDEDFEKAAKVNSKTQLYKQAGNSIVVNVLMAIFNNF